jgi:hypothetical protein
VYKRILQVILAIIGLIALITGALGIVAGMATDFGDFYGVSVSPHIEGNIILDSNLRYFSGLWLGVGLILFWMIPSIERQKLVFRLVAGMIFIGGVGRVISILSFGVPSPLFIAFVVLELLFPLLIIWQNRLSQA